MKHFLSIIVVMISLNFSLQAQKAKIKLGSSVYSGNVNKFNMYSNIELTNKDSIYELGFVAKGVYSETNHIQDNELIQMSLKYDYKPFFKVSPFALISYYKNRYKGYDLRLSGILGAKWTVLKNKNYNYSLSVAYQYDKEQYIGGEKESYYLHRLSVRPKIKQKLGEKITFEHVSFFRPRIEDFNDYQIDANTSITNDITNKLAISIEYELNYNSTPPDETVRKADHITLFSLVIKL